MWHPRLTRETERESRDRPVKSKATVVDWLVFLGLAAVVAMAGWAIAELGIVHTSTKASSAESSPRSRRHFPSSLSP
jgi:hypothetical protein